MRVIRLFLILAVFAIMAASLTGCGSGPATQPSVTQPSGSSTSAATDATSTRQDDSGLNFSGQGNSSGNIVNGGLLALDDGWIYYNSVYDNFGLYKIKLDGSGKTKLCDDYAWCINVVGDWLYYRG
jgi:hypothetical protein